MKKLIAPTIILIFIQIVISFLTENQIVSKSFSYHKNYLILEELKQQNINLTNIYLQNTSFANIETQINQLQLFPIKKTIDLTR